MPAIICAYQCNYLYMSFIYDSEIRDPCLYNGLDVYLTFSSLFIIDTMQMDTLAYSGISFAKFTKYLLKTAQHKPLNLKCSSCIIPMYLYKNCGHLCGRTDRKHRKSCCTIYSIVLNVYTNGDKLKLPFYRLINYRLITGVTALCTACRTRF